MSKSRLLYFASRSLALLGAVALLLTANPYRGAAHAPTSFASAVARASVLGLTVVATHTNGHIAGSVVIAAVPTTRVDMARLCVGNCTSPRWIGRVLVINSQQVCTSGYPAENYRHWGTCVAFGDPELLEQMASVPPAP